MIQEAWIVFDYVIKQFTHGYVFSHVFICKFFLYLNLSRIRMKIWWKNTLHSCSKFQHLSTSL